MKKEKKHKRRQRCVVCKRKIKVMAYLNTEVCSGGCDEKRQTKERDA